jgi:hypothetical protein
LVPLKGAIVVSFERVVAQIALEFSPAFGRGSSLQGVNMTKVLLSGLSLAIISFAMSHAADTAVDDNVALQGT